MSEKLNFANPRDLIANSNIRTVFDDDAIQGLMVSLQEVGMLQPILLRMVDNKPVILDGARRCVAAIRLKWDKVPVLVNTQVLSDAETVQRQLIANCQHEHLTPIELAKAIQSLMDFNQWNATEAAKRIGLALPRVTKTLSLLKLPSPILDMVHQGQIAATSAYELSKIDDPESQAELAEQLRSGKLIRDELVRSVRNRKEKGATAPNERVVGRASASLDSQRSVTVSGPNLDMGSFIAWLEELLAKARRERTRGVELSTFVKVLRDQARAS